MKNNGLEANESSFAGDEMSEQKWGRDLLTNLWNRRSGLEQLETRFAQYEQTALLLFDIDHLKALNGREGYVRGDDEIAKIAREMEEACEQDTLIFRFGGDEFCIALFNVCLEAALKLAEKVRDKRKAVRVETSQGEVSCLTLSVGVAHYPSQVPTLDAMICAADLALLKAKNDGKLSDCTPYSGRNRVMTIGDFMDEFPQESAAFLQPDVNAIEDLGFAVAYNRLSHQRIEALRELVGQIEGDGVSKRASVFAIRNLLDVPEIQDLARSVRYLVEPFLGKDCFAVRGIYFDKTPDANWKVPYHQDLSIAVKEKVETEGFGPWSEKVGVTHVQPPAEVLEKMLTIRLHLDDTDASNGALRVIPGSHKLGKLESGALAPLVSKDEVTVSVPEGDAMLMRPLLLHASSPAQSARHRRVIHLEFAGTELPGELEWLNRI